MNDSVVTFKHIECSQMSEEEIRATSKLFSENYGKWSNCFPDVGKRGQNIKYPPNKIKRDFVDKPDRFVIMAFVNNNPAGHIFYLKRRGSKTAPIIFVLQLVVAKEYRNRKIATRMMKSIWQQTNCYAWGLFTSNPKTVEVLEKATMRKVDLKLIEKKLDKIKEVVTDVFDDMNWIDSYAHGIVSTEFYVDHNNLEKKISDVYKDGEFPLPKDLPEGKEWLAVTFRSQPPMFDSEEEWQSYLEYSQTDIVTAYSNMKMDIQAWAKHTTSEVDYLLRNYIRKSNRILDFGCGLGRHTIELDKRGYDVVGVDFSEKRISQAKALSGKDIFICADVRNYKHNTPVDIVLCLYDVVGSFPNQADNIKILKSANRSLKTGGKIILSVMNMELTRSLCSNIVDDVRENIDILLSLPSSNTMQETGDIFNGRKMIIEDKTGIVYRKEQFSPDDSLPCELIVRDRRYTVSQIQNMLTCCGFEIEYISCFRSGHMDDALASNDRKAKEILVVARKPKLLRRICLKLKQYLKSKEV